MILHCFNVLLVCLVVALNIAAPCMCARYGIEIINVGCERHSPTYFAVVIGSWALSWPLTGAIMKLIPGDHLTFANWFQLALNYEQELLGSAIVGGLLSLILFSFVEKCAPRMLR
jgi:hypothetical protein